LKGLKLGIDTFLIPKRYTYELMRESRAALAKSGTVTLELALHRCPTLVIYQLTFLNRLIAQWVLRLRLPFYCIVNILTHSQVFPEFIGRELSPEEIWMELKGIWREGEERKRVLSGCERAIALLDQRKASKEGASAVKAAIFINSSQDEEGMAKAMPDEED